jgi:asparagine synthase (glutamine-hydrolysing)
MRYGYVPAPYTIYKDVFKLLPGTILRVVPSIPGNVEGPCQYWSIHEDAAHGEPSCLKSDVGDAIAQLDHLLHDAVKVRMISDVPLGAFLSGGIDSSLVVALMQSQSGSPVRTFTIGFEESDFNEAEHAKAVAKHLGTNHTEFYVTAEESKSVIPLLPELYDEPFSDSSQIPTYLVSKLARQHVTVALSGDGGDESFFGYKRYRTARYLWGPIHWLPEAMRSSIAGVLSMVSPTVLKDLLPWITPELNKHGRSGTVGDKLQKAASLLKAKNPEYLYQALVSHWEMPENVVLSAKEPVIPHRASIRANDRNSFCSYMMYQDTVRYLPDDILVKVDRANMGVSLECRNPLLDHRVVEYAWTLPLHMKYNNGQGKWILRQLLEKYLPKEYINRPKSGFTVPIASWLRGPLREWTEDLLNKERLNRDGFFNSALIRRRWEEHLSGTRNWHRQLWAALMFQCWLDRWRYL